MDGLIIVIASFIGLIIILFIAKWIFGLGNIIRYAERTAKEAEISRRIAARMAMKQGVSEEEIKEIINSAYEVKQPNNLSPFTTSK